MMFFVLNSTNENPITNNYLTEFGSRRCQGLVLSNDVNDFEIFGFDIRRKTDN
jgi:hypothetical protein